MDWDIYFMSMVYLISMKSKDPNTKVGAVIVGPDNEIISTGYNSFVFGINDNVEDRFKRPKKYLYFEHGERNSIYLAARNGSRVKGCRMYTVGLPCADCARAIIQSGIIEVIVDSKWSKDDNRQEWNESHEAAREMFVESGVYIREWSGEVITKIIGLKRDIDILED